MDAAQQKRDLKSKDQAAEELGISRSTLNRFLAARRIGHLRVGGRIYLTQQHIDEFWARSERPAEVEIARD